MCSFPFPTKGKKTSHNWNIFFSHWVKEKRNLILSAILTSLPLIIQRNLLNSSKAQACVLNLLNYTTQYMLSCSIKRQLTVIESFHKIISTRTTRPSPSCSEPMICSTNTENWSRTGVKDYCHRHRDGTCIVCWISSRPYYTYST